ncbi:hypothetical protein [Streptomyces sp. NPDC020983]|uniref:hypothetical protein n=1 Tax=Streptomyces sp. NPDC020983 TaxID=3365106 RepID=UPI00378F24EA
MAVGALGGLVCAVLSAAGLQHPSSSGLPGQDGWAAYFVVSLGWGLAAAVTTLLLAFVPSARPARSTVRRMAAADAALLLALLWPLQAPLLALYAVTRRSLPRALRLLAVPVGVAVLLACGRWGIRAWGDAQVYEDGAATAASVAGDWHTTSGGRLHLGTDGRFRATHVPYDVFPTGVPRPDGTVDAAGRWSYDPGPHGTGFTFTLDVSTDPANVWDASTELAPFRAAGVPVLCTELDPDDYCGLGAVFLRSGPEGG